MFLFKDKLLLLKGETVYGTDATPSAANAFLTSELAFSFQGQKVELNYDSGMLGNMGNIPVGTHVQATFKVKLAGSGTAGTAPAYGPALKACRMAEVTDAGVSVTYNPVAGMGDSASLYFFNGGIRYKIFGWRGSFKASLSVLGVPEVEFTGLGLWGGRADTAMPTPTLTAWIDPVEVSAVNTAVTLHTIALNAKSVSIDIANGPKYREATEQAAVILGNRKPTGSVQFDAVALATKDWAAAALARTLGTMTVAHGLTAGNIVTIAAPKVQVELPTWSNDDDILAESLALNFVPDTGNDEFTIAFT